MKIAMLQTDKITDLARFEKYVQNCAKNEVKLFCLPEYSFESFFHTLKNDAQNLACNIEIVQYLRNLCEKYKMSFLSPMVLEKRALDSENAKKKGGKKGAEFVKVLALISESSAKFYAQNRLINYEHWDESEFFCNKNLDSQMPKTPLIFEQDGVKIAAIFGFELHFDEIVAKIKGCDVLILPSACALQSQKRWRELCKTRAFLNSCYILRINRVGNEVVDGLGWEFYGDSLLIDPDGKIADCLQDFEGVMIADIDAQKVTQARDMWKFFE